MKIITISREFGSGGRELGKRMADHLGFDYYDKEIILKIAEKRGLNSTYVENVLENGSMQSFPLTYKNTISSYVATSRIPTDLLIEQTNVIRDIAKSGRDCIIIGRNADDILKEENPLKLFVYADTEAKIRRCIERADENENISEKEMKKKIKQIDSERAKIKEIISGGKWGQKEFYHLMVNTTDRDIKELAPIISEFAMCWFGGK